MNNNQNNPKKQPNQQGPQKPFPIAALIWPLIILAAIAVFIYSSQKKDSTPMNQSTFVKQLEKGNIDKVVLTPENDNIMSVTGKYKSEKMNELKNFNSRVVYTDNLDKTLKKQSSGKNKTEVTIESSNKWISNLIYILVLIAGPILLLYILFAKQMKGAGKGAMQFGKNKARMVTADNNSTKFKDVAGVKEAKEETKEIMDYLSDPLKFKLVGAKIPKGALLVGPPGSGKTLLAKAIAGEADVAFFTISGSDFVEMFVGVGASRVRDMFANARKHAPCLIFIDEIDAVGRSRFSGIGGGHDEREQTLNAILVELDGLETQEGVIVLAATNRPDVLDPALVRPGRFDRQIVLDLPDIKGRKEILDVHAQNIKIADSVDLNVIARGTPGFSGADLANLTNEAALIAARNNREEALNADFEEARDKVCWGRERQSRRISEKEKKLIAYHESGHTLVQLYCKYTSPLHKVTIIPRGVSYLGATMQLAEEDRYTQARVEMEDMMTMAMGGRCAEEIIFGHDYVTSGASNDINQVTKMAKSMICSYGMSDKLGTISYGSREEKVFVGRDITKSEDYSEETAREVDLETRKIVHKAKSRASQILEDHKDELEKLAKELLEKETLSAKEVKKLIGMETDNEEETSEESSSKDKDENSQQNSEEPTEEKQNNTKETDEDSENSSNEKNSKDEESNKD